MALVIDISPAQTRTLVTVPAKPLRSILASVPIPDYDIVQIDVEGFDEAVLEMLWELPWRPRVVCLESCGNPCHRKLKLESFKVVSLPDTVCGFKNMTRAPQSKPTRATGSVIRASLRAL